MQTSQVYLLPLPAPSDRQNQIPFTCLHNILSTLTDVVDGKPAPDQEWYEFFAQLNGTILSLWDAEAVDEAAYQGGQSVMPQFINITDAIITASNPQENPDHYNILSINTAGSNRYLFEFQNPNVLRRWSAAFRIAMYERALLQECYTAALIARSRTAPNVKRLFSAYHGVLGSKGKYSGWVRVRFNWSLKWQKCWVVVSDTPSSWFASSGHGIHERLMYKFSSNKQSLRGEARFYESRRDAKNKPIAILGNVFSAYAVYPEKPFLVDSSTMIKIEGSLHTGRGAPGRQGEQFKDAFILLMPNDMPGSTSNTSSPNSSPVIGSNSSGTFPSSANIPRSRFSSSPSSFFSTWSNTSPKGTSSAAFESMLTWLVAFYDAFNLYGRPEKLITDSSKSESMIFAMPSSLEDSYLDVEEVFLALAEQGSLETNTFSTREWRHKLKELTLFQVQQGKRVFNPAVLLRNAVHEIPVIRQPIPPHMRKSADGTNMPLRGQSAPAVRFQQEPEEFPPPSNRAQAQPPPYPAPVAKPPYPGPHAAQPQRGQTKRGFLRRKGSRPDDRHKRAFSEDNVENTRVAMNRFSLNEDSEDESNNELFHPRVAPPQFYHSSPLRQSQSHSAIDDAEAIEATTLVTRPNLFKRASSHRRVQSETRMADIYREAEETKRGYNSDEESEGHPHIARRVSSDDMLKVQSGGIDHTEGRLSRESMETGTQFGNTFDQKNESRALRISESSSDRSETPADPLRDTPRMDPVNGQSSPASSMESLPPSKLQASPPRGRRSTDDRMYNAGPAPQDPNFNASLYRDQSQPSVLVPVNGQPIPVRRDPSPSRPYAQGPRSAPWSAVPMGKPEDPPYNNDMSRQRDHRPPQGNFPPAVGYPVQPTAPRPQQFPGAPDTRVQDLQMRARTGPPPQQQQYAPDPRHQSPYYAPPPSQTDDHKVPRRMVGGGPAPAANRSRSNPPPMGVPLPQGMGLQGPSPPQGMSAAAARSAFAPVRQGASGNGAQPYRSSRSVSPSKRPPPQGPRQLAPVT